MPRRRNLTRRRKIRHGIARQNPLARGRRSATGSLAMRRLILEEPYSKAAVLSRRLAVFALFVAVLALAGIKSGSDLITVLGGAALIAGAAVLAALLAFAIIWFTGRRGGRQALFGLILA